MSIANDDSSECTDSINVTSAVKEDWIHLANKLGVADKDLAFMLLNNYNNGKKDQLQECSTFDHLSTSSYEEHSNMVLSKLNLQRFSNSCYCDVILEIDGSGKQFLAHSSVLVATLGKSLENKLKNAIQTEVSMQCLDAENCLVPSSNLENDISESYCEEKVINPVEGIEEPTLRKRIQLKVPPGFENVVNFCYSGHFLSFSTDNYAETHLQQTIQVIEEMVDNNDIKEKMLRQLGELEPVVSNVTHDYTTTFARPPTIVEVNQYDSENGDFPVMKRDNKQPRTRLNKMNSADNDYLFYGEEDVLSDDNDVDYKPYTLKYSKNDELSMPVMNKNADDSGSSNNDDLLEQSINTRQKSKTLSRDLASLSDDLMEEICDQCDESFSNSAELMHHIKAVHDGPKKRKRGRPRGSKNKKNHSGNIININIHDDEVSVKQTGMLSNKKLCKPRMKFNRSYKESIGECCDEHFFNKFRFGVHLFEKHCDVLVECVDCSKLVLLNELISHFQLVHGFGAYPSHKSKTALPVLTESDSIKDCANINEIIANNDSINPDMPLQYDPGDMISRADSSWRKEVVCRTCCLTFTILDFVQHLEKQLESAKSVPSQSMALHKWHRCLLFQCQICKNTHQNEEKPIKLYQLVKKHVDRYHLRNSCGDEKESCYVCGRMVLKYYFEKHQNYHRYGAPESSATLQRIPCDICGKFITKKRISVHRRTHFDRYPCPKCSRVFNRKENLKVHERIHTGEKPFVCDICGKGFRQYVELRLHNRKHEKDRQRTEAPVVNHQLLSGSLMVKDGKDRLQRMETRVVNPQLFSGPLMKDGIVVKQLLSHLF